MGTKKPVKGRFFTSPLQIKFRKPLKTVKKKYISFLLNSMCNALNLYR
jgi:hypothetical protein